MTKLLKIFSKDHKAIKMISAELGITMQELIGVLLEEYRAKHN